MDFSQFVCLYYHVYMCNMHLGCIMIYIYILFIFYVCYLYYIILSLYIYIYIHMCVVFIFGTNLALAATGPSVAEVLGHVGHSPKPNFVNCCNFRAMVLVNDQQSVLVIFHLVIGQWPQSYQHPVDGPTKSESPVETGVLSHQFIGFQHVSTIR